MNRFSPSQLLGLLLLGQAVLEIKYPIIAVRSFGLLQSFGQLEAVTVGINMATLGVWALLVASALGLLLKKRWTLPCMFGFAALSPLAMLPFMPLVMRCFTPGELSFLVWMVIINLLVVALAFYLIRRESIAKAL